MSSTSNLALTPHAVQAIITDDSKAADPRFTPLLQVINIKQIPGSDATTGVRYRLILSDGTHFVNGMMASQMSALVASGELQLNGILQLKSFMRNLIQGQTICILLDVEILSGSVPRIGAPVAFDPNAARPAVASSTTNAAPLYNSTNDTSEQATVSPPAHKKAKSNAGGVSGSSPRNNPYGARPNSAHSSSGGSHPNQYASSSTSAPPIVRSNHVATPYTSISDLNMYQSRWTIRARLTSKSEIRTWSNAKGEGSLFSVEFLDESMDIRATFFREAVDKFYALLEVGKVYTVAGGRLKVANMQYNTCKSQFEMSFDQNAEIHLDQSAEAAAMATQSYELVKIGSLEEVAAGQTVDVFGVCTQVGDVATILSKKSGKELTKCDLVLQDDSAAQINLTLWGQVAADAAGQITAGASLVAIRRARVSDYNGKSLSGSQSHTVVPFDKVASMEDKTLQAAATPLLQWYQAQGGAAVKALSTARGGGGARPVLADRKPIQSIREDHLGTSGDAADWISFKGEISFIKKDKEGGAWYTACPNAGEPCQNRYKVTPTTDGQYHCEKCGSYYPNTVRRWIFSAMLEDGSGSTWASFFNDQAETLLGTTADEVYTASGGVESHPQVYEAAFAQAAHSEWVFRCKVKQDIVNDEARVKTSVVSMFPLDYVQDAKDMLAALQL